MELRERMVLILFTLINSIANNFLPFYSDETYYWMWSKKLALSYFDHPPMVAYLIKITTLFGDSPLEIRLAAPLLMAGSAYILYKLAWLMYDKKTALYTFYIFLSGVIVQGGFTLITPDIPLIFFWTLTLYTTYYYMETQEPKYAYLTGVFVGALLLSKYTGVLLLASLTLYILIFKRELLTKRHTYIAIILALILFSPVVYWNAIHEYISFKFQLGHGIAKEKIFDLDNLIKFVSAQLLLFHPLYILPLFFFMVQDRELFSRKKLFLVLPFLFPLGFFVYFSAFKHANAQWAAPAYISASLLLGVYLAQRGLKSLVVAAMVLTLFVILLVKTPLGERITVIHNFKTRAGMIDNFSDDIKNMGIDINHYNYILIDDYHGTDVAYHFGVPSKVLVLNNARFSNFNIWRNEDLNISMDSPPTNIPKLGKMLYVGVSDYHLYQLTQLFGKPDTVVVKKKSIANKELIYYFAQFHN